MLESMVGTLDYKNYMIFVGTYRNDERTKNEVERMRRRYRQLVRVEVPHDGPTDRKSTRLNSSHLVISYAVFCLKKKKQDRVLHHESRFMTCSCGAVTVPMACTCSL